jgi:uncharacterized protein (DUF697 family)
MDSASKTITAFSAAAAAISFVSRPIPVAGSVLSFSAQVLLGASLMMEKGKSLGDVPWGDITLRALKTSVPMLLTDLTIGRIPVVGNVTNAVVAYLSTRKLGRHIEDVLLDELTPMT